MDATKRCARCGATERRAELEHRAVKDSPSRGGADIWLCTDTDACDQRKRRGGR
ncbi:hypothetical protein [Streptomyces boncukensis]|uniref:Uncharacterized protein n=1 Tax=Streptomyces boncukensis TaxID=2711219 RepID=A0A6G4X5N9_9ACTN|nr:hypothetical protein [Streptomyces boncukensis]NGO72835.1 hypothetical protein [Streptomyces boncukensis]